MTIRELIPVLDARVLCGEDKLDQEVKSACGSDLMSDVLAFVKDKTVLITGLTNIHVMRTAEMLDIHCVVFARGKVPLGGNSGGGKGPGHRGAGDGTRPPIPPAG